MFEYCVGMETGLQKEEALELRRTIGLERVSIKDSAMPNAPIQLDIRSSSQF